MSNGSESESPKRTVSAPPPPRRRAEVNLDDEPNSVGHHAHRLNLAGFASTASAPMAPVFEPSPPVAPVAVMVPGAAAVLSLHGELVGPDTAMVSDPEAAGPDSSTLPDAAATESGSVPARRSRRPSSHSSGERPASGMAKVTVQLPNRVIDRLRVWTASTGRTNADAVLTAYLNYLSTVERRFAPTPEDRRRAELGLPPLAVAPNVVAKDAAGRRGQIGLYVRSTAIAQVDQAAAKLSISRSELVTALLDLEFGDAASGPGSS
jgi:hypothetical protein